MKNAVGVLGGVGPMATVYFMDLIIEMTEASKDQDHINMLVSNHATIPDRTEYIMRRSDESPLDVMVEDARMLARSGCEFLVIPCNTAHYFLEEIQSSVTIPVLNIIEETIKFSREKIGTADAPLKTLGIMATEGTITSGTFSHYGTPMGVKAVAPDTVFQKKVNHIIYDLVKAGKPVAEEEMMEVIDHLRSKGCDAVIMGCTELSIAYKDLQLGAKNSDVIDTLEVLARATVLRSGKQLRQEI